jgi:hypothetical protein
MSRRLSILLGTAILLTLALSSAWAVGCPPGTKQHCMPTKNGVQCYCR